jgi:hypothetical protein
MNLSNVKSFLKRDMKNFKWWSAVGMVAVGLTLAGCGGSSSNSSAAIRVANATLTHPSLDLWVTNAITTATATALNTVSAYVSAPSGAATLQLDDKGSSTGLAISTPTLAGGQHYTLLAYESGATGGSVVKMYPLPEDWTIPAQAGNTQVRILDFAPEAGNLDVYVSASPVAAGGTPAGYVGSFNASVAQAIVLSEGSGTYYVTVTASNNLADVRMLNMPVAVTSQQVATVSLTPASGGSLLDGSLLIQQGAFTTFRNTGTRVRLASAVPGAATVNATVTTAGVTSPLDGGVAPQFGSYTVIPSTSTLNITVAGATIAAPTGLVKGADMTLLVFGAPGSATASLIADDNRPPTNPALVKMRLINGITGNSSNVLKLIANGVALATGVAPGTASAYGSAGINSYGNVSLSLSSSLNSNLIPPTALTAFTLNPNTTYTVFAVGDYSTASTGGLSLMVQ